MATVHSQDLVWQIIRTHNAALVKRGNEGAVFSRERFNLRNKHSFSSSGFLNSGVDVQAGEKKGEVKVTLKSTKPSQLAQPVLNARANPLNKDFRRGARSVKASVKPYRPDLTDAALARYSALKRISTKPATGRVRKPRGNNARK